jgi:transcriptional regulator with XRE-family HTH domain
MAHTTRHFLIYGIVMPESSPSDVFPDRLRTAREKRDLNQAGLAKRAGLQVSAISHFETGTRKPSFDNLRRLADALDVTTDYLLGRVDALDGLAAGASKLHRHGAKLTATDLELTEEFMKLLERRNKRD